MRLSRRTRLGGVALLAAIGLTLSGCGGGGGDDSNESSDSTDAVITARSTEPQNPLVPQATNEVGGGNVIDLLYAGLITYKEDGSQELEVAESITSDDNKTWTVKLNDWKFSDGTAVTAKSFVDAWNYGSLGKNAQNAAYFYYPIEGTTDEGVIVDGADTMSGLKVVDDKTFTITLKQPESDFPLRLGYSAYYPLPESAYADMKNSSEYRQGSPILAARFLQEFVGDGPWAHLDIAGTAYLERSRDDYYGAPGATGYGVRLLAELARRFS